MGASRKRSGPEGQGSWGGAGGEEDFGFSLCDPETTWRHWLPLLGVVLWRAEVREEGANLGFYEEQDWALCGFQGRSWAPGRTPLLGGRD